MARHMVCQTIFWQTSNKGGFGFGEPIDGAYDELHYPCTIHILDHEGFGGILGFILFDFWGLENLMVSL